ncbi:MAG: ABC transporter ATP-binding protein [Chloroflexi bacterium]|nr:ABC transporter ATP-binding protein [Chloroflexota bacterium]
MTAPSRPVEVSPARVSTWIRQQRAFNPNWQFFFDVGQLIVAHKWYSLAIILVTVAQEIVALWPVALLGQFVDRLQTGDLGNVVWLFMGASLLYPAIMRGNVILRHKMFYETDYSKRLEMTLSESDRDQYHDVEEASAAHTRVVNAVSGITNAAYHILGSFTPVIIKIIVVSSRLLAYNRMLGLVYLATLLVPGAMTILFNNKLRVLRDAQYSAISRASGTGVRVIADKRDEAARQRFFEVMRERTNVLVSLMTNNQIFIYVREAALVGSQFLVVLLAVGMRERIGLTPGDFTKIVGYTTQVAAAFITTATVLDAIVSHCRAYHVYAAARRPPTLTPRPIP